MALFKKVSAATLALLMTASAVSASAASEKILLSSRIGDGDNNGVVSANDYVAIANYIVNADKSGAVYNADYNFDGAVDAADLTFLRKVLMDKKIKGAIANPGKEYDTMRSNYLDAKKSQATSKFDTVLVVKNAADKKNHTESQLTVTNGVSCMTSKSDNATQTLWLEAENGKLSAYKQVGSSNWDKYTVAADAIGDEVVKVVKANQFTEAAALPSYDIIELLLTTKIDESAFANSYSYVAEDGTKCILLPAEDIITGDEDIAGSFIIKITKNNAPISIEIKIGTATKGDTYIVENGIVTFDTSDKIEDLSIPAELKGGNTDPNVTTPAETTAPAVSTTPAETTTSTTEATTPAETTAATTEATTTTSETTTTTVAETQEKINPYDGEDGILSILKKSAKYLAKAENVKIDVDTAETVTNQGATYSNATKATAYRDGKAGKVVVDNGTLTYNDGTSTDTFVYDGADAVVIYNEDGTAEVFGNVTVTDGKETLFEANNLYKKGSREDIASLKTDLIKSGREAYKNILNDIIARKTAENNDLVEIQKEATDLQDRADKLSDAIKKAQDLLDRANALEAEKTALEAEKKALEDEKAALEANPNATQAEADALKAKADNLQTKADDLQAKADDLQKEADEFEATAEYADLKKLNEDKDAFLNKYNASSVDELKASLQPRIDAVNKEIKQFEDYQTKALSNAKEQMSVKIPSFDYIKNILGVDVASLSDISADSITETFNNDKNSARFKAPNVEFGTAASDENTIIFRFNPSFFNSFDTEQEWVNNSNIVVEYTVEKISLTADSDEPTFEEYDYKPVKFRVYGINDAKEVVSAEVKAVEQAEGANKITAIVEDSVIDFYFPDDTVPADWKVTRPVLTTTVDPVDFIAEPIVEDADGNVTKGAFARFVSKFIENKAIKK